MDKMCVMCYVKLEPTKNKFYFICPSCNHFLLECAKCGDQDLPMEIKNGGIKGDQSYCRDCFKNRNITKRRRNIV